MFATNTTLSSVVRKTEVDKYGRPTSSAVYSDIRCWLESSFVRQRDNTGDRGTVPSTLSIDGYYDLHIGDLLTVDNANEDKYSVTNSREQYDITGSILSREYDLMRQR